MSEQVGFGVVAQRCFAVSLVTIYFRIHQTYALDIARHTDNTTLNITRHTDRTTLDIARHTDHTVVNERGQNTRDPSEDQWQGRVVHCLRFADVRPGRRAAAGASLALSIVPRPVPEHEHAV